MEVTTTQSVTARAPARLQAAWWRPALVLVGLALLTFALWLPFGWNVAPVLDSWSLLVWVDSGARPFFFPDIAPTRPLTYNPWIISLALTPDSFVGHNLLFAAVLFGTGAAMYALMRQLLPRQPLFAWFAAALIIVFPADHGIFYLDAVNIRASFMLVLIAINLLISYWRRPALPKLLAALLFQVVAVLMYEAGIPLLVLSPLLLLWLEKRLTRRWWVVAVIWAAFPLAWFLYFISTVITGASGYQRGLLDTDSSLAALIGGLLFMARQNLWTGFAIGWERLGAALNGALNPIFLSVALLVSIGVGAVAWVCGKADRDAPLSTKHGFVIITAGLVALLAGFAVYIPTQDFHNMHYIWRLFYFTSLGGTVVVLGVMLMLVNLRRRVRLALYGGLALLAILIVQPLPTFFVMALVIGGLLMLPRQIAFASVAALLVGLATLRGLEQHNEMVTRTEKQKVLAAGVIAQAPAVADGTLVLVLDGSTDGDMRAYGFNYAFEHALSLIYQHRRSFGRICYVTPRPTEFCRFEDGQITVPGIWGGEESYPYERVVAFRYDETNGMVLLDTIPELYLSGADASAYNPSALIDAGAPLPPRLFTMLSYKRVTE